jgi:hypothetical protein
MPSYLFQTDGPLGTHSATVELLNHHAAQIEAVRYLGDLLKSEAGSFWDQEMIRVTVSNEAGLTLFILDLTATRAPVLQAQPSAR